MTRTKVWRYQCSFCDHANCSASAVAKHERGCTRNPNRVCGMCKKAGFVQKPMENLLFAMSIPAWLGKKWEPLREITSNCPACMLAAIRQSPHGETYLFDFDYRAEHKRFWEAHEADKARRREMEPSSFQEALKAIHKAGGKVWDGVGSEQEQKP